MGPSASRVPSCRFGHRFASRSGGEAREDVAVLRLVEGAHGLGAHVPLRHDGEAEPGGRGVVLHPVDANVTPTERGAHAAVHGHPYGRRRNARGRGGGAREGLGDAREARGAVLEVLARPEGGKDLLPGGRAERRGGGSGPPRRARARGGRDLPGGGARIVSPAQRGDLRWVWQRFEKPSLRLVGTASRAELVDDLAHVLGAVLRDDQDCVACVDDADVVKTNRRDEAAAPPPEGAAPGGAGGGGAG